MNPQTAENLRLHNETANSFRFGSPTETLIPQRKLEKKFTEELLSSKIYKLDLDDDTTFPDDINNLHPQVILPRQSRYSFSILQEWEGYVVSISEDTFTARLLDVTRDSKIENEEADFSLDDLDDADRKKISPGAVFRWVVGYRRNPGGTKDRSSRIVFRNLPAWTAREITKNKEDAIAWSTQLNFK